MTEEEALMRVLRELDAAETPYVVVGSFASNQHGEVRSTKDFDVVIDGSLEVARRIAKILAPHYKLDPQIHFETVTGTSYVRFINQFGDFKIELFRLTDEPHDVERFRRRVLWNFGDFKAHILAAEDVVVTKLNWWTRNRRAKDWADAVTVAGVQWDHLDWKYVGLWAERLSFTDELARLRTEVGTRLGKPASP